MDFDVKDRSILRSIMSSEEGKASTHEVEVLV